MFDPTIGRWISEDPKGFEAGDSNLYRYVGNNPTIATDPSGFQRFEENRPFQLSEMLITLRLGNPSSKKTILKGVPFFRFGDIPLLPETIKEGFDVKRVGTGFGWSGVIPDGKYAGPDGCGPCVGVVLVPPKPGMKTYVIHFDARTNIRYAF